MRSAIAAAAIAAACMNACCSRTSPPATSAPTDPERVEAAQLLWDACIALPESPEALGRLVLEVDGQDPRAVCLKCEALPAGGLGWIHPCWDDFRRACGEIVEVCSPYDVDGGADAAP